MVNYPGLNKKYQSKSLISVKNTRGMSLEKDLDDSNTYYKEVNRALIYKKPTPIQVVRVDYQKRSSAKIVEAYFRLPSTTDYSGVYRSKAIDFEAKETSKEYFPLSIIHEHQIAHLQKAKFHGAITFLIIYFKNYDQVFLIDGDLIVKSYLVNPKDKLSYQYFVEHAHLISQSYSPRLKYLDLVDKLYFKE